MVLIEPTYTHTDLGAHAISAPYRLRRPVGSSAKLLSRLRRFLPAGPVDRQLRKNFALNS